MKIIKTDLHAGPKRKSVMMSKELHDRLNNCVIAKRGDSFATIIEKLLDYYEDDN